MRLILGLLMLTSSYATASVRVPSPCRIPWTVQATRDQHILSLDLREEGSGPACDLVVTSLDYLDGAAILSARITPAKFCPVDAIAQRHAVLLWSLPQELRSKGVLKFIVNGSEVGVLSVGLGQVDFKGGCQ